MPLRPSARMLMVALTMSVTLGPVDRALAQSCSTPRTNLFLNPYGKASAHHRPIGSGARFASNTDAATRDWLKSTHLNVNVGAPWGTSLTETDGGDPIRVIRGQARCDNVVGLPVSVRLPREGFRTTIAHNSSGCPDGVVVVYDRVTGRPHQLRQYDWNNGQPTAGQYKTWDIRGLGHGTRPGHREGTSASGVAGMFGVLRGFEINTPGHKIEHALRLGLPRKPGCKIMLSRNFVLPATSGDSNRTRSGYNTGHIPYGGLLALPPSVNVNNLGLSEPGRRLAAAIQNYGMYATDGGGCTAGAIDADQNITSGIKSQLRTDIRKIYPLVRLVTNNAMGSAVAGGGSPRAPNCAFNS